MSKKVKYIYIRHGKPFFMGDEKILHTAVRSYVRSSYPDIIVDGSEKIYCEYFEQEYTIDKEGYQKVRYDMDSAISNDGYIPRYDGIIGCAVMNQAISPPARMQIIIAVVGDGDVTLQSGKRVTQNRIVKYVYYRMGMPYYEEGLHHLYAKVINRLDDANGLEAAHDIKVYSNINVEDYSDDEEGYSKCCDELAELMYRDGIEPDFEQYMGTSYEIEHKNGTSRVQLIYVFTDD